MGYESSLCDEKYVEVAETGLFSVLRESRESGHVINRCSHSTRPHAYHTWCQAFAYGKHPSKYGKYHTFFVFVIYYKVKNLKKFKVRKLKIRKSVQKKHKNVFIKYAFSFIRMKTNVCLCIRVYYVLYTYTYP